MRLVLWTSAGAAASIVAYLMIGYVVAARLSAPVRQPVERTPADVGLDYREVAVRSTDGLSLSAWWVDKAGSSRAAVLVHGWAGDKSNLHVVETALVYERAGFNVLMLDLRGHGKSEGERGTLGYREVRDVRGALSWLQERGFDPEDVVLHGWSMGGAAVVQVAPGTGVAAVVEEAAYADLPPLLRERIPEVSGLPAFFNPGIFLVGKLFLDIDPWAVRPVEEAGRLSRGHPVHDHPLPRRRGDPLRARRVVRGRLPRGHLLGSKGLRARRGPRSPGVPREATGLSR
jgi:pimeloyl-ACP methyl ester carboxylesterase